MDFEMQYSLADLINTILIAKPDRLVIDHDPRNLQYGWTDGTTRWRIRLSNMTHMKTPVLDHFDTFFNTGEGGQALFIQFLLDQIKGGATSWPHYERPSPDTTLGKNPEN